MASKAHQFIADSISIKMRQEGYEIVAYEGKSALRNVNLKLPPKIVRHRPDLIGIRQDGFAIGEAKTATDFGRRTIEQILDFTKTNDLNDSVLYKIYFGIPLSCNNQFKAYLKDLKIDISNICILTIPDRLLPED